MFKCLDDRPSVLKAREIGIDLDKNYPKNVDQFINKSFDYIITVCNHAKETCPVFMGDVKHHPHIGFDDPAEATGTDKEILALFRRVRDEIRKNFYKFYKEKLTGSHDQPDSEGYNVDSH